MKVLIINGPNLNLLGTREPDIYGPKSLEEIINWTEQKATSLAHKITWFQSNHEGPIIDQIQKANSDGVEAIIINPGGYTHSSVAILDALKAFKGKIIETHLSNTNAREDFRKVKITTNAANSVLEGFGDKSYFLALMSLTLN